MYKLVGFFVLGLSVGCGTESKPDAPITLEVALSPNPVQTGYTAGFTVSLSDSLSEPYQYLWKLQSQGGASEEITTDENYLYWTAPQDTGTYAHTVQAVNLTGEPLTEETSFTSRVVPREWQPDDPFYENAELLYSIDNEGVYLMDVETGESRLIAEDVGSPRWSPEGDRIAVVGRYEKGLLATQIFVMNADGSNKWLLTRSDWIYENGPSHYISTGPVWSPDGNRIAYNRCNCEARGDYEIVIADLDTTNGFRETVITDNSHSDKVNDWSSNGYELLIQSEERLDGTSGRWDQLYSINQYGQSKSLLVSITSEFGIREARYSPDGQTIAFIGGVNGIHEIYLVARTGENLTMITDNRFNEDHLGWLPSGKSLVFTMRRDSGSTTGVYTARNLYTINVDGSNLLQLTSEVEEYIDVGWRPNHF